MENHGGRGLMGNNEVVLMIRLNCLQTGMKVQAHENFLANEIASTRTQKSTPEEMFNA